MRGVKSHVILTEKEQKDFSLPPEIDSNLLLKSFSAGNRLQIQNFLKRSPPFFSGKKKFFCVFFQGNRKGGWDLATEPAFLSGRMNLERKLLQGKRLIEVE